MNRSLHGRLIALIGASVLVLFVISGIAACWLIEASLWSEFDSGLQDRVQSLSQLVEQDYEGLIFEWQEGGGVATPIDANGEVLSVWKDGQVVNQFPQHAALEINVQSRRELVDVQLADAKSGRAALLTFQPRVELEDLEGNEHADPPSATVTMAFARPTAAVDSTIHRLRSLLALVGIVGLLATLGMTWLAVNLGLKPIDTATDQIASIQSESLDQRIDESPNQPRELRPLVQTINRLLSRLQSTLDHERAFSADVAHEMRTPLAGLRAKLDVALSKPRTVADHENTLGQCLEIAEQTSLIVESLLATTRHHSRNATFEANDIRSLVIEIASGQEGYITERGLAVNWEIPDGVIVNGPSQTVGMLFRNLIGNAVDYADPGSTIDIVTEVMPKSLVVRISNPAQDFPACDIEKVFERFWRADSSRTATGKHSGLGLPLCQRLTHSLGGTLDATYENGLFEIRLMLPR